VTGAAFVPPEQLLTVADILKHSHANVESEIQGGSMGATLPAGARIRVSCTDRPEYRTGDVLVYVMDGRLIAHRMVGRGRRARVLRFLITRGDAAVNCDPPVPVERTVGHVTEWRAREVASWNGIGPAPRHSVIGALMRRANLAAISMLLEIHPLLARGVAIAAWRVRGLLARGRAIAGTRS
jgi:hypothetical protein